MTYRNPNSSGYTFIGKYGERKVVEPLCVGSFKVFEKVNNAIMGSEHKAYVKVCVVRQYTNVYIYRRKKFDDVLLFLKNIIE